MTWQIYIHFDDETKRYLVNCECPKNWVYDNFESDDYKTFDYSPY